MPLPYFAKFPKMAYDVAGDGANLKVVVDVIHRAKFKDVVKSNIIVFYPYSVQDGDTPEIIAAKLYGSAQYHWVILFVNDIHNLWTDWPLDYFQFEKFLIKKYGAISTAQSTIHHYETADGQWIDLATYNDTIVDGSVSVDAYDYEVSVNDAKREIEVVDPQYIGQIDNELDKLMVPTVR